MFKKAKLNFWQIINMNVGFFGIQYSFGLQQSAVNPIYDFLHASPDQIPILNRAGQLFDMSNAPFEEKLTAIDEKTKPIKDRLQGILDGLNPGAGILDKGDGTGRHANKTKKKAKN